MKLIWIVIISINLLLSPSFLQNSSNKLNWFGYLDSKEYENAATLNLDELFFLIICLKVKSVVLTRNFNEASAIGHRWPLHVYIYMLSIVRDIHDRYIGFHPFMTFF